MKKILWAATVMLLAAGCSEKDAYKITGNLTGLEGPVMLVDEYGEEMERTESSGGKFTFSGTVQETTPVLLMDGMEPFALVFLEPGKIKVQGNIIEGAIKVTGTKANDRSTAFDEAYTAFMEDFFAGEGEPDVETFINESNRISEEAIDLNLDNFFGLYMLSEAEKKWTAAQTLEKLDQFPAELRENGYAKKIRERAMAKMRTEVGQPYTEIALPDRDGTETRLSSYVGDGKYVLIDFWASWCGPCMNELPHLKEAYAKYRRNGFEIYGVSLDQTREAWMKAIDDHKMGWVNVFHEAGRNATGDYSVVSIPTNFLIGPDGAIVARDLRGEELENTLAQYIK